jgi:hypothetical protein
MIVITSVDISTVCVPDPHPVAVAQPLHRIILADPQSNLTDLFSKVCFHFMNKS